MGIPNMYMVKSLVLFLITQVCLHVPSLHTFTPFINIDGYCIFPFNDAFLQQMHDIEKKRKSAMYRVNFIFV